MDGVKVRDKVFFYGVPRVLSTLGPIFDSKIKIVQNEKLAHF